MCVGGGAEAVRQGWGSAEPESRQGWSESGIGSCRPCRRNASESAAESAGRKAPLRRKSGKRLQEEEADSEGPGSAIT